MRLSSPLVPLLLALLLCTCDRAKNSGEGDQPAEPVATGSEAESAFAGEDERNVLYPSMPFERLKYIFEHATYMDATFYDLPISINQSSPEQIQATIAGVGSLPMNFADGCKPMGHIWFQVNGKNVEEADIYFAQTCAGYVWYDGGKPAYSNALTEQGANFYLNILQSVQQNAGQAQ